MFHEPDRDGASDRVQFRPCDSLGTPLYLPRNLADALARHDGLDPTTTVIKQANGKRRYVAQIKSFPFRDPTHSERRIALALVVYDPDRPSSINEELLQSAYDLTKSEARVCSLLVNGRSVDDISVALNISPYTVRTHLQRVFHKTGSTRQMDVVKLVLNTATLRRSETSPIPPPLGITSTPSVPIILGPSGHPASSLHDRDRGLTTHPNGIGSRHWPTTASKIARST
jgi:DNA-binding CsgD family transcriptional regulator